MRIRIKALTVAAATALATIGAVHFAQPAAAASLVEVTNFGTNPSGLRMHLYVPDNAPARPAIVVAIHYCGGTGPGFFSGTEYATLANRYGFIVIYPSVTRSTGCFDVYTPEALRHNGGSDPVGIVSMVNYVVQQRNDDRRLHLEQPVRPGADHQDPAAMGRRGPQRLPRVHRAAPAHAGVARHQRRHAAVPELQRDHQAVDQRPRRQPDADLLVDDQR